MNGVFLQDQSNHSPIGLGHIVTPCFQPVPVDEESGVD